MPDYDYVIVGGGMTADAAVKGIRASDPTGSIAVISQEPHKPYSRPPLSKALWKGDAEETIWRKTPEDGVTFHTGISVQSVAPPAHQVIDSQRRTYGYRKLLLATGGVVRRLPWELEGIIYFRTLDDYRRLRKMADAGGTFVVIGGGFIGSEIAAALAMQGRKVTMIFPEGGIGARVYPQRLSLHLNAFYASKGVDVRAGHSVAGIERRGSRLVVKTTQGDELDTDGVIAGIGIVPDTRLALAAGLETENGIIVDEQLRTSNHDIYAAGDVANFMSPALGKRIRLEHEDNALTMGGTAGRNMAGGTESYRHLPFFYSDLFELGYEAVGDLDSRMQVVEDWKEEFREGVLYYLDKSRVRGVLLWNTWGQVEAARALIAGGKSVDPAHLAGILPVTT